MTEGEREGGREEEEWRQGVRESEGKVGGGEGRERREREERREGGREGGRHISTPSQSQWHDSQWVEGGWEVGEEVEV